MDEVKCIGHALPSEERLEAISKKLDGLYSRVNKRWTTRDESLWSQLLDACYEMEMASLEREGYRSARLKNLVSKEWAWWEQPTCCFVTGSNPPDHVSAVPVIVVQRDGGFEIHEEILNYLWVHPLLADTIVSSGGNSPRDVFKKTRQMVAEIMQKHVLYDWEHIGVIAGQRGSDQGAALCAFAALELDIALEPDYTEAGGTEDLAWLTEAKQGGRLWRLLNAAIELGQSLQHYRTFWDSSIEDTIRRMKTVYSGKETTPEGQAVEQIIEEFCANNEDNPTPRNLYKWLKGEPLKESNTALVVNHPLWVPVLQGVSWERFQHLVKSARRRI